jgi:hypothetical protein
VVEENKRQLCVFKLLSDKKAAPKWWDYAAGFAAECTMANGRFGDAACIKTLLDLVRPFPLFICPFTCNYAYVVMSCSLCVRFLVSQPAPSWCMLSAHGIGRWRLESEGAMVFACYQMAMYDRVGCAGRQVGLSESEVDTCMGDSTADSEHELLEVRGAHQPWLFPK